MNERQYSIPLTRAQVNCILEALGENADAWERRAERVGYSDTSGAGPDCIARMSASDDLAAYIRDAVSEGEGIDPFWALGPGEYWHIHHSVLERIEP